ncbi:O-acetyl-ADP-ribose deacetylase [Brevibacterium sp. CS2]|uniref:O-acetyl-ADP-ribose deacetylase n=1 Tax=Brevibacterium sp. CS2 TaxID=2575923 RepID=UPI0010C7C4E0|nr:O-acetyl-ADP-ribose deacetylase [Brevibacterium sp. CS2]QCP05384.1 O-acetyl-ADP-ribose deacetylase [Brevibacterium sp. CS2]
MDITLRTGDITTSTAHAIVNAANSSLLGGGGVDGAIHRAAGPELLAECQELRATTHPDGLPPGRAIATGAGALPARWVIHTVGPNRHTGQTDVAVLESCFATALDEAERIGARTLAFPAIGAGVYGWDAAEVARAALRVLTDAGAAERWPGVGSVEFVLFGDAVADAFAAVF